MYPCWYNDNLARWNQPEYPSKTERTMIELWVTDFVCIMYVGISLIVIISLKIADFTRKIEREQCTIPAEL